MARVSQESRHPASDGLASRREPGLPVLPPLLLLGGMAAQLPLRHIPNKNKPELNF